MPKSTKAAAAKPAKETKPTPTKVEEVKPVTIFANPKTEAEMVPPPPPPEEGAKPPKKAEPRASATKRRPVTLETGKCYRFAKGDDVFFGKVADFTQSTADLKIFRNGEHSNVQTFDRKGLTAKEVSAEVAYNSSLNPGHYDG